MDVLDFEKILDDRISKMKSSLSLKAREYAINDRLYNFKRAANIQNITPEKALLGMLSKHLVSVFDLIEGNIENTEYLVNEKIGDTINYFVLLEALFTERRKNENI